MIKVDKTRDLAVSILQRIESGEAFSTQLINQSIQRGKQGLDDRDQRFLRELVYGSLENKLYLAYLVNQVSKRNVDKLKVSIKEILLLAAYEIFFLSTADHAVVNEYVNIGKRYDYHAKGYVNAVIRNLIRQKDEISDIEQLPIKERISIRYSHPQWMLDIISDYFDDQIAEEIARKNNQAPPLSLFVNPTKLSREEALTSLEHEGLVNPRLSQLSNHAILVDGGPVTSSSLFLGGEISIQSQPSIKTAEAVVEGSFIKESKILDLCAAPGSKTLALASMVPNSKIVANDVSDQKIEKIKENISRFNLTNIETSVHDASQLNSEWIGEFDAVLVDAPCSGLGLLRKKPDIRWNRKKEDIATLSRLQAEIINKALLYVKKGGRLVYSTCTYGNQENEQIAALIEQAPDYYREALDDKEALHFHPLIEDSDGFFISRFRRE